MWQMYRGICDIGLLCTSSSILHWKHYYVVFSHNVCYRCQTGVFWSTWMVSICNGCVLGGCDWRAMDVGWACDGWLWWISGFLMEVCYVDGNVVDEYMLHCVDCIANVIVFVILQLYVMWLLCLTLHFVVKGSFYMTNIYIYIPTRRWIYLYCGTHNPKT